MPARRTPLVRPPGSRLGKYELVRPLATGGMAELHLARARGIQGFEKLVALKRILPSLAADEEFTRMFLDEARLAARLHHPNIVEVFDIGESDGEYFFTMEYVRGRDLLDVIAAAVKTGRGLTLENALHVVAQIAEGLHHAHEKRGDDGQPLGLVHRDVSPTNVLLTYDGRVKVCDFGIAKAVARHTRPTGTVKGKVAYMSPEQCQAIPLDRRSDVFSVGVILYELTTGRRLFRGQSDYQIYQRIVQGEVPPPSSVVPGYSPTLERIVMRALSVDREDRYATARELQSEIEELARDQKLRLSSVNLARFMAELYPHAGEEGEEDPEAPGEPRMTTRQTERLSPPGALPGATEGGVPREEATRGHAPAALPARRRVGVLVAAGVLAIAAAGGLALAMRHGATRAAETAPGRAGGIEPAGAPSPLPEGHVPVGRGAVAGAEPAPTAGSEPAPTAGSEPAATAGSEPAPVAAPPERPAVSAAPPETGAHGRGAAAKTARTAPPAASGAVPAEPERPAPAEPEPAAAKPVAAPPPIEPANERPPLQ